MPKTILVLCPDSPYPPIYGARIDMWGHIQFFHRAGWRVVVVACMTPQVAAARGAPRLPYPIDIAVHAVQRGPRWSRDTCAETLSKLQELVESYDPDVILCEYADFSPLVSCLDLRGAALWFRPQNLELAHALEKTLLYRPWRRESHFTLRRTLGWLKGLFIPKPRIFSAERRMHRMADRLFFISHGDMRVMGRLYGGGARKDWVPTFLERDLVLVKENKAPLDVFYLGSDLLANINADGAHVFLDEVAPAVERAMPGAFRFHLVGSGSAEHFGSYASRTVAVHGFVSDLSAFVANMDMACIPLKFGWGLKVRMVEALACGLPVIAAPQTLRGVPATPGAYYACRSTGEYVAAFRALQDSRARERVGLAGRAAYEGWRAEGQRILGAALDEVTENRAER